MKNFNFDEIVELQIQFYYRSQRGFFFAPSQSSSIKDDQTSKKLEEKIITKNIGHSS